MSRSAEEIEAALERAEETIERLSAQLKTEKEWVRQYRDAYCQGAETTERLSAELVSIKTAAEDATEFTLAIVNRELRAEIDQWKTWGAMEQVRAEKAEAAIPTTEQIEECKRLGDEYAWRTEILDRAALHAALYALRGEP